MYQKIWIRKLSGEKWIRKLSGEKLNVPIKMTPRKKTKVKNETIERQKFTGLLINQINQIKRIYY